MRKRERGERREKEREGRRWKYAIECERSYILSPSIFNKLTVWLRCDLVVSLACLHLIFASIHSFIDLVNFVVRFGEIKNVCRIWQCSNIRTWCDISKKAIQRGADDERCETRENWWQAHSIEPTAKINCWINSVYAGCERAKIESVHTSNLSTTLKEWTKNDDAVGNESEFPNKCIGIYIYLVEKDDWKKVIKMKWEKKE